MGVLKEAISKSVLLLIKNGCIKLFQKALFIYTHFFISTWPIKHMKPFLKSVLVLIKKMGLFYRVVNYMNVFE